MNLLDILIVVALVAIFGVVFFAGLARALVTLLALWIGLIGADIFGNLIGDLLGGVIPNIEPWTADLIGFLLSFAIIAVLVVYLAIRSFRTLSARSRHRLDQRGGAPVMALTVVLALIVSLASVTVFVELVSESIEEIPEGERPTFAARQYEEASLRPATERVATYVYDATGSWVPGGAPSVLAPDD